jgi:hypothetical protein
MSRSRACSTVVPLVVFAFAGCKTGPKPAEPALDGAFAEEFGEANADLASTGTNPWFVLQPGNVLELEGVEDGRPHHLTVTVLDQTETIDGVTTRVVEERETSAGVLVEVSRNYFAISKRTNAVYYFGEDVDVWKHGKVVSHEGAWRAGVNGARYGMMMPGRPVVGQRYMQEIAPDVAMDRAEVVDLDAKLAGPLGGFDHLLKVEETTPLEPDAREAKYYAKGVGLVRDGGVQLVQTGSALGR